MTTYRTLREANDARHIEWDPADVSSHSFYATELAGEMGEALAACYLDQTSITAVSEELADTVICLDLVARRFGITLTLPDAKKKSGHTISSFADGIKLAAQVGFACNIIKKLEREELGMVGSRSTPAQLAVHLDAAAGHAAVIAATFGVDLQAAIADKFNKTSRKYGLATMLEL